MDSKINVIEKKDTWVLTDLPTRAKKVGVEKGRQVQGVPCRKGLCTTTWS